MTSTYALKLGFRVYKTSVGAKKIDDFIFEIFKMVLASFSLKKKLERA